MYYIQENDKPSAITKIFQKIEVDSNKIILPIIDGNKIEKNNIKPENNTKTKSNTKAESNIKKENSTKNNIKIINNTKSKENLKPKKDPKNKEKLEKKEEKITNKLIKLLKNKPSKKLVLSKNLHKCQHLINTLNQKDFEIIDGRWIFERISKEVLEYILDKQNLKKEETSIYILVNDLTDVVIQNIKEFAKEYKSVNIITNHIEKLRKIADDILKDLGIQIVVANNKRKSLTKAKIILNYDFPKELLNQYNINENAIIINILGNMKITKKRFNGITINDYEISFKTENEYNINNNKFFPKEIYEAQFYKEQPYINVREKILKDKVKIEKLYTQNGEF